MFKVKKFDVYTGWPLNVNIEGGDALADIMT